MIWFLIIVHAVGFIVFFIKLGLVVPEDLPFGVVLFASALWPLTFVIVTFHIVYESLERRYRMWRRGIR